MLMIPIASTGAAALQLYEETANTRLDLKNQLSYPILFRNLLREITTYYNCSMTEDIKMKMIRDFIKECNEDPSRLLTGYQLINEFSDRFYPDKNPRRNETTETKLDLADILEKLFNNGELSNAFCDKIVENDHCPLEFKTVLKRPY